jgi:hypothetical protein
MTRNWKIKANSFFRFLWVFPAGSAMLLCFSLLPAVPDAVASPPSNKPDWQRIYDPGIPPSVSVRWSFPTGFSLGIDSGYQLRIKDGDPSSSDDHAKINLFPVSFLMKYPLYESTRVSQSVGIGFGPCFFHQGRMPIKLGDMDVTGSSTWFTEWVSHLSQDLYVNVKMKYTHAFQSAVNGIPLWDLTTWLGMNLRW